ncbi:MAG: DUF1328 domain-containing protein [Aequorivita sp.]|nr:MAG: DUF1328 domain-containing protein [Aequorivita sp.]
MNYNPFNLLFMLWTILFLFLAVVAAVLGFLGLGFGPIEPAKTAFYVFGTCLLISLFMQRRKKKRKSYYE